METKDESKPATQSGAKPEEKAEKPKSKRKRKRMTANSSAAVVNDRYCKVIKAAEAEKHPHVRADLELAEVTWRLFGQLGTEHMLSMRRLKELREQFHQQQASVQVAGRNFQLGLRSSRLGESFVTGNQRHDPIVMARFLCTNVTDQVLAHNKPLQDELKASLAHLDRLEREFKQLKAECAQLSQREKRTKRRLQLAMQMLSASLQRSRAEQEMGRLLE